MRKREEEEASQTSGSSWLTKDICVCTLLADWLHVLDRQIGSICMPIASHEIDLAVNPDSLRLKAYLEFMNGFGIEFLVREAMTSAQGLF